MKKEVRQALRKRIKRIQYCSANHGCFYKDDDGVCLSNKKCKAQQDVKALQPAAQPKVAIKPLSNGLPINQLLLGDCCKIMQKFPSNSIDCVVTDPPYGLKFMGKKWDEALPPKEAFRQMYRILKPGALAFVMSSPRQDLLWRMLKMLEEVGFELRQSFVAWIYKTGFPKAYDVSKGIDKKFGKKEERKTGEVRRLVEDITHGSYIGGYKGNTSTTKPVEYEEPVTRQVKKWNGWKSITGLKPALECILMVNKPKSEKTIVDNVLKHGVGAINVDACRIPFETQQDKSEVEFNYEGGTERTIQKRHWHGYDLSRSTHLSLKGRFPANLLVSNQALSCFKYFNLDKWSQHHGFLDVPKASKSERDKGLEGLEGKDRVYDSMGINTPEGIKKRGRHPDKAKKNKNFHPTVKPIKLMTYLIELGCPPDGIVLDPFVGSGTTCIAAKLLGRRYIGMELNPEYANIAKLRIKAYEP